MVNDPSAARQPGPRSCRVIAALDGNHNGDLDQARRLIDAAGEAGADGIKLQKRSVALAAVRPVLDRAEPRYRSLGATYRKALERLDLPVDLLGRLGEHAGHLEVLLAPYDLEALRQLEGVRCSAFKVDPPLATHLPLLEALGASGRPTVAAVAGCTGDEVEAMLGRLGDPVTLMYTLWQSPFAAGITDVAHLVPLRRFGRPVGYADNALDPAFALVAMALGAVVIEKRLTLDRSLPGPHHATSLLPHELADLVRKVRALEAVLGSDRLRDPSPVELDDLEGERVSIVAARPIARGETITREMLALKPPFRGLSPRLLGFLVGRRALYDVAEDEFLTFGVVEL